ncbi:MULTISPECIES: alpha-ketoglutarate-dependent dioxygenase AlkB family protein [Pseudomonas]|uniref:alpha-ketoglutarate-dependent dioxygenase AlkB family protein n=1 Tax=Pseudomonas TaxID=286 RepID=UPI002580C0F7|nr:MULTISPECIES: alpha-ketoglutarate-dependent dioxygenase AlkB [Pseudomonas]
MDLFADIPLQLADADLRYQPDWLDAETADAWLQALMCDTPWEQPIVQVHGRRLPVPRLVAWYADPGIHLSYSGLTHRASSWTPLLAQIRRRVEDAAGQAFNGVLINHYRDGQDSMGWHADDESYLGRNPVIASLNLGGARRFDLRRKGQSRIEHSLTLGHGSLLVMGGTTQHHWQHQVAKTRKACAPRLNLTFRYLQTQHR